jgi:hypothetical protein
MGFNGILMGLTIYKHDFMVIYHGEFDEFWMGFDGDFFRAMGSLNHETHDEMVIE